MKIEKNIKLILAGCVILLLVGNGITIFRNYSQEWRRYQAEYIQKSHELAADEQVKKSIAARKPRIEQLIVRDFGEERVDRCITCHAGIDDKRFADAPQPFKTHPPIIETHPYLRFGCTLCHEGNGRGLSVYDAHGEDEYWLTPLLKGEYTESACAKCHPAPYLAETPLLRKGAELFVTLACYGCHKIEGVSEGSLGVELTTTGNKWKAEYFEESILYPKANNRDSLMPQMGLDKEQVKALVIYLESLTGENLADGPVRDYLAQKARAQRQEAEIEISAASGEKLFKIKSCTACHRIGAEGNRLAPELSTVGLQRSKEWILQHFIDPRSLVGGSIMPDFPLTEAEMQSLTLYLLDQKRPDIYEL